jgi:hypothetical protein
MTNVFDPDSIVLESIPDAPPRPPGKGREPVKWEEHLAPLESKLLETPARLWAYENKTGATSRMLAVRSRITAAAPHKNWEFKVRPVPNSDLHGVYAVYHGEFTPDEQLANAKGRAERAAKLAASRALGTSAAPTPTEPAPEAPAATEAPKTPKEKLAAAAKK